MTSVVVDTNVVVSAHLNEDGQEATVLDLVFVGDLQLFVSPAILEEYALTLARPKFSTVNPDQIKETLAALRARATLIEPRHMLSISTDEPVECAETSGANFLVTGNKRHFPEIWKSTRVVSARQLLEALNETRPG